MLSIGTTSGYVTLVILSITVIFGVTVIFGIIVDRH
jgi:hypothetical protein